VAGEATRGIAKKGCNVGLSAYPQHDRTAQAAATRNLSNTPGRPKRVSRRCSPSSLGRAPRVAPASGRGNGPSAHQHGQINIPACRNRATLCLAGNNVLESVAARTYHLNDGGYSRCQRSKTCLQPLKSSLRPRLRAVR
jgi:hypothetical protein